MHQFERYIIQIDTRAQGVGVQGRRGYLQVDIMRAQVLIGIVDTIQFQLSVAVQVASFAPEIQLKGSIGTEVIKRHRTVRQTRISA